MTKRIRLEAIRLATPCAERWDDMVGDERARRCERCEKNVYDVSRMSRADAEVFLAERIESGEGACVRLHRRRDGTILTSDCPIASQPRRRAARVLAAAAAALLPAACTLTPGDAQPRAYEQTSGNELVDAGTNDGPPDGSMETDDDERGLTQEAEPTTEGDPLDYVLGVVASSE